MPIKKNNVFLLLKGGSIIDQDERVVETKNNEVKKMPNMLTSLQQELQKIQIKPKYIKINLKK